MARTLPPKTRTGKSRKRRSFHRWERGTAIRLGRSEFILNFRFITGLQTGHSFDGFHRSHFLEQLLAPLRVAEQETIGEIDPGVTFTGTLAGALGAPAVSAQNLAQIRDFRDGAEPLDIQYQIVAVAGSEGC